MQQPDPGDGETPDPSRNPKREDPGKPIPVGEPGQPSKPQEEDHR